ncbi:MAG: LLM class flavin-dependent oxidoreductase [Candidatus Bathyarchaeota archaeon]|nr:LLM class flavin-dependent oxidoreductase [Candidatus Bathyarchaeota archaeon]
MHLSIGLTTSISTNRMKWIYENADNLRLHGLWIGEDIGRPQEIFTSTALLLLNTKNVNVGIGVTSPLIRNITTIARASSTLSEIAPNRFRMGLGIGGIQDLTSLGIPIKKPVHSMERAVEILRTIWVNNVNSISNEELGIHNYTAKYSSKHIPIFFGVRGPKLMTLAASIADGVILSGPRQFVEKSIKLIKEKRNSLNLSSEKFHFVLWVPTILIRKNEDLEIVKKTVAIVALDTPDHILEMSGINKSEIFLIRSEMKDHGIEKVAEKIPDRIIDLLCISGDADEICDKFESYSSLGIQEVVFGPPYGKDARKSMAQIAQTWSKNS